MANTSHSLDLEKQEQDEILANLNALTATVGNNTTSISNISLTPINNKLAGSVSSGLKTLIEANDDDIENIKDKTDYVTVTGNINLDTVLSNTNTNNSKVTYPSSDSVKVGRITINGNLNLSTMSSNITTNINAIDAIEVKTDNISVTQAVNLDTMESGIATNVTGINGILNHSIDSNLKAFVDANSNKTGITTAQTNAIVANTAKTGISTAQTNAIVANTAKTGISTAQTNAIVANTAKTGISTAQTNAIVANTSKTGITGVQSNNILNNNDKIGISLSQISAISSNTSGVSALVLAYPRNTIVRHYNYTTADIYNDGTIKFNWDATNKQLRFWCLSIGTNEYLVGGVRIWKGTTEIRKSIYVSQNVSTAYKYFTGSQVSPSSSVVDNTYDLKTSYGTAEYFLCPYLENNYPTYEIKILIGYHLGWHTIHIKRFN